MSDSYHDHHVELLPQVLCSTKLSQIYTVHRIILFRQPRKMVRDIRFFLANHRKYPRRFEGTNGHVIRLGLFPKIPNTAHVIPGMEGLSTVADFIKKKATQNVGRVLRGGYRTAH